VISAVLFGALASTGALPFECGRFEDSIRRGGVGVQSSLDAFAAGLNARAAKSEAQTEELPRNGPLASRIEADFPAACHDVLFAGVQRLADYQDQGYAAEYLDRLDAVRAVDAQGELLRETGRYLALWMSYEDAIRVADLKIRRERFERVHGEARVGAGQVLKIHEFLHPRVQEIADILPAGLGRWLLGSGWARGLVERYTRRGRVVETTSLAGYMQLYALARLRPLRRRSLRFETEHRRIGAWLTTVLEVAREDYALAVEVAECPRLVKGYGDTHRRGSESFDALMGALPKLRQAGDGAAQMKRLREAALLRVE
jgi:indolepyruvate ferredoxin oxidoreductase, beta subunit